MAQPMFVRHLWLYVVRCLSDEWELVVHSLLSVQLMQCVCVAQLKLLSKLMTGEECAQLLLVILSTELAIAPDFIVATMRDSVIRWQ